MDARILLKTVTRGDRSKHALRNSRYMASRLNDKVSEPFPLGGKKRPLTVETEVASVEVWYCDKQVTSELEHYTSEQVNEL